MKKINGLLILMIFMLSCSQKVELDNMKTDSHKFVKNTRVFITPAEYGDYRKATSYNGFEEMKEAWKLRIMDSPKTIEELEEAYSKDVLRTTLQAEWVEKVKVVHSNGYEGFYVNYKEPRKKEVIHMLVLKLEDEVIRVKGTYYSERSPEEINEQVKQAVLGIYIASTEEAVEAQKIAETLPDKDNNIFILPISGFKFAGELNTFYYFSKDGEYPTSSSDSAWIAFKPIWNASKSQWMESVFKSHLGEDYEITKKDERGRNDVSWLAKKSDNSKMAIAGIVWGNNINLIKGSFNDNFEENSEKFIKMAMETKMK